LFLALCFAAPAFAGDITFSVSSSADKQFTIGYDADPGEGPVGIGLKVTVTGTCSGSVSGAANVVSSDPCFDVYIDYAHDLPDPNTYTIGMGGQYPLADPCEAGVPDPGSKEFSICMGRLDPCNPAPSDVADLVTIELDCDAACTVTVDVEADNLRGGIVGANWDTVNASASTSVVCTDGGFVCPWPCWEFDSQCYGDVDGDDDVDTTDWPVFRDAFGCAWPQACYDACADLDHDGDVDTTDWPNFRDNFGSGNVPNDCPMTCVWPPA
jgi:hypothetical protein